jgi:hypothetical protein
LELSVYDAQSALRADFSTAASLSGTSALGSYGIRAAFDSFPLVIEHLVGRVPETPSSPLMPTVRPDQGVPPRALLLPLPRGEAGAALHRALDHPLHLGSGRVDPHVHLGKRLRGWHPIRAEALAPLGARVLPQAAHTRGDIHGCMLHPVGPVRAVLLRAPLALIALEAPDRHRGAHHVLGHVTRHAVRRRGDGALLDVGHQAVGLRPKTRLHPLVDRLRLARVAHPAQHVPLPRATQKTRRARPAEAPSARPGPPRPRWWRADAGAGEPAPGGHGGGAWS